MAAFVNAVVVFLRRDFTNLKEKRMITRRVEDRFKRDNWRSVLQVNRNDPKVIEFAVAVVGFSPLDAKQRFEKTLTVLEEIIDADVYALDVEEVALS